MKSIREDCCGAETRLYRANEVNIIAADVLAPYVARTSAAMVLILQDEWLLVFLDEGFQEPAPHQCGEMRENAIIFLCFLKKLQHNKA